jgi:hypothetical protein
LINKTRPYNEKDDQFWSTNNEYIIGIRCNACSREIRGEERERKNLMTEKENIMEKEKIMTASEDHGPVLFSYPYRGCQDGNHLFAGVWAKLSMMTRCVSYDYDYYYEC